MRRRYGGRAGPVRTRGHVSSTAQMPRSDHFSRRPAPPAPRTRARAPGRGRRGTARSPTGRPVTTTGSSPCRSVGVGAGVGAPDRRTGTPAGRTSATPARPGSPTKSSTGPAGEVARLPARLRPAQVLVVDEVLQGVEQPVHRRQGVRREPRVRAAARPARRSRCARAAPSRARSARTSAGTAMPAAPSGLVSRTSRCATRSLAVQPRTAWARPRRAASAVSQRPSRSRRAREVLMSRGGLAHGRAA